MQKGGVNKKISLQTIMEVTFWLEVVGDSLPDYVRGEKVSTWFLLVAAKDHPLLTSLRPQRWPPSSDYLVII